MMNYQTPRPAWLGYLSGQQQRSFAPPGFQQNLPSMQRYTRMAPSEQAGFQGWLGDQAGVHAPDVQWLMQRLAPPTRFQPQQSFQGASYPRWLR